MRAAVGVPVAAATVVAALAGAYAPAAADVAASRAGVCGGERWAVKTMADPAARLVDLRPRSTTVAALRRLHAPNELGARARGVETTSYRVRARLLAFKLEEDGDIHLVVADPQTGGTMITEFPASYCTIEARPRARRLMSRARQSLIRACGSPSSTFFTSLGGVAIVSGVGFFDFQHGQFGVAPNAIELHPVLSFRSPRCSRAP